MKIELAPMEGITTYIYRNALNKYYGGVEIYYTPFISTHKDKSLNFKEIKELKPENNQGIYLIPQILTNNAKEFFFTSSQIKEYGYNYINLNFGCPSGTVTSKGKGSGALQDINALEKLLDEIFSKTDLKISVKTRMGYADPSEWENLIHVYEKFPIEELIVHARVREDFYNGYARIQALAGYPFPDCLKLSYNGDIFSSYDVECVQKLIPHADAVMVGRGIISNPNLASEIKSYSENKRNKCEFDKSVFKAFNHELIDKYSDIMPGEKNTLFKLKELWIYMIKHFERMELGINENYRPDFKDVPNDSNSKKLLKSIRKCNSIIEYERIIDTI